MKTDIRLVTDERSDTNRAMDVKEKLLCPLHREALQFDQALGDCKGVPLADLNITCPQGCRYRVEGGIPRLVPRDNYASAFGLQWQRYQKTQLDSYTGQPYSRWRLERCLGMPLSGLKDKVVLECGAGAGRFTELLIDHCQELVAVDLSLAVDANLKNCAGKSPYLLLQGDINKSPLPFRFFDVVICLGVVQHTPSPEQTIASLAKHVKPGGLLVFDHYTYRSRFGAAGQILTMAYPLRAILKRVRPELGLRITIGLTKAFDVVRKNTCKVRWLDRFACRVFPSACYYNEYPLLSPEILYQWNELDTHDTLTDYYKHFRTENQLRACLSELEFDVASCSLAGNGVEIRAIAPVPENEGLDRQRDVPVDEQRAMRG